MNSLRTKLLLLLALPTLLVWAACTRDLSLETNIGVDSASVREGDGHAGDGMALDASVLVRQRWLRQLVEAYNDDTTMHLAIATCATTSGEGRIMVMLSANYPYTSAVLYTPDGAALDTMDCGYQAMVDRGIAPDSRRYIYRNYRHRSGEGFCNVEEPMRDMEWLSLYAEEHSAPSQVTGKVYSLQFEYEGERHDGFYADECCNCSDSFQYLYDCLGNVLQVYGGIAGLGGDSPYHIDWETAVVIFES